MRKRSTLLGTLSFIVTAVLINSALLPSNLAFAVTTNYVPTKIVTTSVEKIYGKFTDTSGKPLKDVVVEVHATRSSKKVVLATTKTSANGTYRVEFKPTNAATVGVSIKYKKVLKTISLEIKKGKTAQVSGKLISSPVLKFLPILTY
jgi:5-hydroxyisourate hydrolase-like protein (transthyretin family)